MRMIKNHSKYELRKKADMDFKKLTFVSLIAASMLSPTSQADVGFGGGITYIFGQGFAVGVKAFTSNNEDEAAGSIGLDYMLPTGGWRPNVGISYLGDNIYGDINVGYDYQQSSWNFGVGAGGVNTEEDTLPDLPLIPPPPPPLP